jgi:hypothetical protein
MQLAEAAFSPSHGQEVVAECGTWQISSVLPHKSDDAWQRLEQMQADALGTGQGKASQSDGGECGHHESTRG